MKHEYLLAQEAVDAHRRRITQDALRRRRQLRNARARRRGRHGRWLPRGPLRAIHRLLRSPLRPS